MPYADAAQSTFGTGLSAQQGLAQQGNQFTQNIVNNPFSQGYQSSAAGAAGQLGQLGQSLQGGSQNLFGAAGAGLPYAQSLLSTAFDPQNALYARTQQQNSQQNLAGLAASGTAMTPFGAGVAGMENSNFNIDWQNTQLQRQLAGAQGYGSMLGSIGGAYGQAGNLGQAGAQATLGAGQLPWSTSNAINQSPLAALSGQQQLWQQPIGNASNYIGQVIQNYQNQYAQWQGEQEQYTQMMKGVGSILTGGGDFAMGMLGGGGKGGGGGLGSLGALAGLLML